MFGRRSREPRRALQPKTPEKPVRPSMGFELSQRDDGMIHIQISRSAGSRENVIVSPSEVHTLRFELVDYLLQGGGFPKEIRFTPVDRKPLQFNESGQGRQLYRSTVNIELPDAESANAFLDACTALDS